LTTKISYCEAMETNNLIERDWLRAMCYFVRYDDWNSELNPLSPTDKEFHELWPKGFDQISGFDYDYDDNIIFFHSYDGGLDVVCAIVQEFLKKFRKGEGTKWALAYAEHCDGQPITGVFGGGAIIVTEDNIIRHNVRDWLQQQLKSEEGEQTDVRN
jgi:hypothetical protein